MSLGTLELFDVLLIEVSLDGHIAATTLLEVDLLAALAKLVLRIATHLDDLRAPRTVGQHLALQDVVEVHLVCAQELRR